MGCTQLDYAGKPVIGIINTWSEANPCHIHLRERAEDVKRGVLQAGGFPMEIPAISLGETLQKPTTMMYRNLLAAGEGRAQTAENIVQSRMRPTQSGNVCPSDWMVCGKQQEQGSRNGSPLCSTI